MKKLNVDPIFFLLPEVVADETKAVDAVVKADKKRLALIEECERLTAESEKGITKNATRLQEVRMFPGSSNGRGRD
jgi:ATP-binding cassette subfamily F protein 1